MAAEHSHLPLCRKAARRRRCDPMTTHGFFESGSEIGNRARSSSWWMPCSEALVVRAWRRLPMSSLGLYSKRPQRSSRSRCSSIRSPIKFRLSYIFYLTESNSIGSKITRCSYPTKSKSNRILVPKFNWIWIWSNPFPGNVLLSSDSVGMTMDGRLLYCPCHAVIQTSVQVIIVTFTPRLRFS